MFSLIIVVYLLFKFLRITFVTYVVLQEKIDDLILKNPETALDISPNDPVGVIFCKERPGRVRKMSFGACSFLVFKKSTTRLTGMHHASSSAPSPQVEDKVVKMETKLATLKEQMNSLLVYIATRSDVPEHVAAMTPNLVNASNNFAIVLTCTSCYSI